MTVLKDLLKIKIKGKEKTFAFLLLAAFFIISATSVLHKYLTMDESVYIVAGYSYLKTLDFRINWEHPIFMKALYGLPLLFLNPELPIEGNRNWEKCSNNDVSAAYGFASDFYIKNKDNIRIIIFWPRIVAVLTATLLGIVVFLWAKDAFGPKAGILALVLYCFEPNIIAHGSIATLDIPMTFFVFASFYTMWKFMQNWRFRFLALSSIFISLAIMTKYTALIFVPLLFVFSFFYFKEVKSRLKQKRPEMKKTKTFFFVSLAYAAILLCLIIGPIIITNIIYSFDAYKEKYFYVLPARVFEGYQFMSGWVKGGREGWFFGQFRQYIPEYYIGSFLIKTTVPFVLFSIISVILFAKRILKYLFHRKALGKDALALEKGSIIDLASVALPGLAFFIALSIFGRFYIGFRYALPAFPFLIVFVAGNISPHIENPFKEKKKIVAIVILALLFWHLLSAVFIYPHYLAYFNELIGGPANGPKYLTDSSIDWGQDFFYFMDFAKKRNWENPHLIYFGWPYPNFLMQFHWEDICEWREEKFAISASAITGVVSDWNCHRWLLGYEPKERIGWTIYYYEFDSNSISGEN